MTDKMWWWLADHLPYRLLYFAVVRAVGLASFQFPHTPLPSLEPGQILGTIDLFSKEDDRS